MKLVGVTLLLLSCLVLIQSVPVEPEKGEDSIKPTGANSEYCDRNSVSQDLHFERIYPSCSLLGDYLHCFGGGINEIGETVLKDIGESTNSHVVLDLKAFDGFQNPNSSTAKWSSAPSTINNNNLSPRAHGATTSISSNNSFVILGGYNNYNTKSNTLEFPFIKYDASSRQWLALPPPPHYTANVSIVNIENDQIWAWGLDSNNDAYPGILSVFNISNYTWSQPFSMNMPEGRFGHTATLDNKGIIHIIGGYFPRMGSMPHLRTVSTFNTGTYQWNTFNTTFISDFPPDMDVSKMYHTATLVPNTDLLIVYGGMVVESGQRKAAGDPYYIYDISNNTFTHIPLTDIDYTLTFKYGHSAAIYKNYLLLSYGNNVKRLNAFTASLAVLNITNPIKPELVYMTDPKITNLQTKDGLTKGEIAAIVIGVTLGISIIIGVFIYVRYKKRKQRKAFILEQEDPRRDLGNYYESQSNSFVTKPFDSGENEKFTSVKPNDGKMDRRSSALSNSNETNVQTEISENTNKTLV
ncbi:unnamed protein product [Cunninghamella blakesleeana]